MTDMLYEKQGSYLQGKREGREEGWAEGRKEGVAEGFQEAKYVIAKVMLDRNEPLDKICAYTELTEAEVLALKESR